MSGRWSRGLWEDFWNTWFQWSPFGRPKRNTAVPCSSTTYRRVFRRKSPRSGTTPPWTRRGKRLPITVSALWHEARHIIQRKSDLFSRKNNFLFSSILSFFAAVIGLTVETLFFVFSSLPSLVASVPLPLHYLLLEAEKKLTQHSRHLRLVGLPLWAVFGCLIQSLEDLEALEHISGLTLDRGVKEPLSLLAECLQFIIGVQQKVWFGVNVITTTLNRRVAYVKMHHFYHIWIVPSRVLFHFSRCSVHLTGNSQTRNAQSAAGSGGAKTKVDEYTVAEGSTALFTQVRCQTPGILARGQFKTLLQYHNFRKSIPSFS